MILLLEMWGCSRTLCAVFVAGGGITHQVFGAGAPGGSWADQGHKCVILKLVLTHLPWNWMSA